ncbi:GDNF family receptor alpha-1 [Cricetulus griseus]|uniref:GDNF family receptor alpha-1 n=1 Tax=Cricetulus griseus TaxID=10029 RepID=G3IEW7_CRIGR|nr:GDNF family receptor alpha-1 [Cricetulus griseus]ERE80949.1 GDNF family receptor alpha-2 [Cricetulus griseus]
MPSAPRHGSEEGPRAAADWLAGRLCSSRWPTEALTTFLGGPGRDDGSSPRGVKMVSQKRDLLLSAEVSGGDRLDCVKASDQCLKEQSCSTKYRTLRQCVAGKETNFSLASGLEAKDECRSAMEALKQKSLYNCRCKRGMKKEKNCLRIYWSMYQSLQGNDLLEDSPYEPVNSRLSDIFRAVPFIAGKLIYTSPAIPSPA